MTKYIKEPRLWMLISIYIASFFHFFALKAEGYEGNNPASVYDLVKGHFNYIWSAKVLLLAPVVIIVCSILLDKLLNKKSAQKILYLFGSVFGALVTVFVFVYGGKRFKDLGAPSDLDMSLQSDVDLVKIVPSIGFFLIMAIWIIILAWTLINDFAISKESVKEKGLQGTINSIASQTIDETNQVLDAKIDVDKVTSSFNKYAGINKIPCPFCGEMIAADDGFCTFCGKKVEKPEKASDKPTKKVTIKVADKNAKTTHVTPTRLTVENYLKSLKNYSCDSCGEIINPSDLFCPACGNPVVIKESPKTCSNCGKDIMKDFSFCPYCGLKVKKITLRTKCSKCGADLLYGKEFCVKCGAKIEE